MSQKLSDPVVSMRSWIFTAALLLGLALLGFMSSGYADFINEHELARVNVYGHRIMSRDRLSGMLEKYYGAPLNSLDISEIRNEFVEYPLVQSVKVTKHYPDELDIYIRELVPVAYIQLDQVLTVDTGATLLPLPDNGMLYNLPIITRIDAGLAGAVIGEKLESDLVESLVKYLAEVRRSHPGIYLDISEVTFSPDQGLKIISALNSTPVLLGDWDNAREAIYVLSAFVEGELSEQVIDDYEYIDLRFANQIIVKERD